MLGVAQPLPGSESGEGKGDGDGDGNTFVFPTECPACGTTVVKEEVGGVGVVSLALLRSVSEDWRTGGVDWT